MPQQHILTESGINDFLGFLENKKRRTRTLLIYKHNLYFFYKFLPENKQISKNTILDWQSHLINAGLSVNTINSRISVANRYIKYIGKPSWCAPLICKESSDLVDLSRDEYLRLLKASLKVNNHEAYLFMKLICILGLSTKEISEITIERIMSLSMPVSLRRDLLLYAYERGVFSGPVFLNLDGKLLSEKEINAIIQSVCKDAGVSSNKTNSRALKRLHTETYKSIRDKYLDKIEEDYYSFIDNEEKAFDKNA